MCEAQTHKMAVAITGSTDNKGSTCGTAGARTTRLGTFKNTGPWCWLLRSLDLRPLVILSAGTLRLGKAEKTGFGTTRLGKNNQQVKDIPTRLKTTMLESPGTGLGSNETRLGSNETTELLGTGTYGLWSTEITRLRNTGTTRLGSTGLGNTVVGPPG